MKTSLFKASEIQDFKDDEFKIAKWFLALISAELLRKITKTKAELVCIHITSGAMHTDVFLSFPIFEGELHWTVQKTGCRTQSFNAVWAQTRIWIWMYILWLALQSLMKVLQWRLRNSGQPTLKGYFCEADYIIKSEIPMKKCGHYLF